MTQHIVAYIAVLVFFLAVDALWLGVIAKDFFQDQLGGLLRQDINYVVAFGFYCLYAVGIVIFAVAPALAQGVWWHALLYGALFGFFAYGTYDATNYATLKDWPLTMSLVDTLWGTTLTGASALAGFFATRVILS